MLWEGEKSCPSLRYITSNCWLEDWIGGKKYAEVKLFCLQWNINSCTQQGCICFITSSKAYSHLLSSSIRVCLHDLVSLFSAKGRECNTSGWKFKESFFRHLAEINTNFLLQPIFFINFPGLKKKFGKNYSSKSSRPARREVFLKLDKCRVGPFLKTDFLWHKISGE